MQALCKSRPTYLASEQRLQRHEQLRADKSLRHPPQRGTGCQDVPRPSIAPLRKDLAGRAMAS
eukprot:scaffold5337_cov411-Prasinococcus_capsulatus_cf.AAC.14